MELACDFGVGSIPGVRIFKTGSPPSLGLPGDPLSLNLSAHGSNASLKLGLTGPSSLRSVFGGERIAGRVAPSLSGKSVGSCVSMSDLVRHVWLRHIKVGYVVFIP